MPDVQDTSQAEPSMEEILASIRKIIADDGTSAAADGSDVLELTQMVQDDGSVVDLTEKIEEPVSAAPPQPPPPPPVVEPPEPVIEEKPFVPQPSGGLVSGPAESAAVSSLSTLASSLEIERLSAMPTGTTYLGNGQRTLEDMVIELMRPMLRDWLDKNLPATVDRLVQKEIERIARRAKD